MSSGLIKTKAIELHHESPTTGICGRIEMHMCKSVGYTDAIVYFFDRAQWGG